MSSPAAPTGFVTGLAAEARIARRLGPAQAGGGLPAGAAAAAERLVAAGATALVSFGLCGGLDPELAPGALIVPRLVVDEGRDYAADARLGATLGGFSAAVLLAAAVPAVTAAAKQALFAGTAAAAVDLESGAVARVALERGLPFAVLRAVCDDAAFDLPPAALLALDAAGRLRPWAVAGSLLGRSGQVAAMVRLARAAAVARAALVRRVRDIGPAAFGRWRTMA